MLSRAVFCVNRRFSQVRLKKPVYLSKHFVANSSAALPLGHFDVIVPSRRYADTAHRVQEKASDEKHEFQAETKMLLDIVAKSLYSHKEVFLRELISNACDALEKFRFQQSNSAENASQELKIDITTNKQERIITIEDNGIGMNKEDLISNLGTIARSGSKAFIEELKSKGQTEQSNAVIGQFGVGFYSVFMVADKVIVLSKSSDGTAHQWTSDGSSTYSLCEAEKSSPGTQIIIHLKPESREYADEGTVEQLIKKHSGFVRFPVNLNGRTVNTMKPLWTLNPKEVTLQEHNAFFQSISNSFDNVRYVLHYKTDVPITLNALIYVPEGKPGLFSLNSSDDSGLQLYARRVLIKKKAVEILPKWLRFVKGVVDSEDLPLNLSRELLQNSPLIQKIKSVITTRIIKFLQEKATKDKTGYNLFYKDYSIFLKEGVILGETQTDKEEAAKLLLFESSKFPSGETISLNDYCKRMDPNQKRIYYLAAPSRDLAETSPYFESLKERDVEVLFCYESYDEVVLMHLKEFNSCGVMSIEQELRKDATSSTEKLGPDCLQQPELDKVMSWFKNSLKNKIDAVLINQKLDSHPCIVTVEEMALARHFVKTQAHMFTDDMKYSLLKPRLEINPRHPLIKHLSVLSTTNEELATLVADQLFKNALVFAGLLEDPRRAVTNIHKILELSLLKK